MKDQITKIETADCLISILNNAPSGFKEIKSIVFRFKDPKHLALLNLPKLKYLDIIHSFNDLSFHLSYEPLRQFFNNFIDGIEKTISKSDTGNELVAKINKALKDLIKMAERELTLSVNSCMGLFGELTLLKELLQNKNDQIKILASWNRPAPANHDFDYEGEAIEVKTISKDKTTVKITSEFQLEAPTGKSLFLKIYRIETVIQNETDSLGDLYTEIENIFSNDVQRDEFISKCAEDNIKYGGPRFVKLPFKFIVIESMKYEVNQSLFPMIKRHNLPSSISNISYRIDLSAIDSFKVN